jgi:hypothetical protein
MGPTFSGEALDIIAAIQRDAGRSHAHGRDLPEAAPEPKRVRDHLSDERSACGCKKLSCGMRDRHHWQCYSEPPDQSRTAAFKRERMK